jgi:hypothetical protein
MFGLLRAEPSRHMPMEKVMATLTAWKFDTPRVPTRR